MQYSAKSPREYVDQLPDDWRREKVCALREIIQKRCPQLTETINYKMLGYGDGGNMVFHLNAQKNYVSLYVGNASKIDPDGKLLEGLNVGKGCIRFTKFIHIPETRIDEFIEKAVRAWEQGEDIDC